ncbi:MAG: hypothetical protein DMG06_13525 [Acidobacteria bacterium]|nr:MAG: hypothetical protein DMG06_13525 [Acidobacteriota bacterium]
MEEIWRAMRTSHTERAVTLLATDVQPGATGQAQIQCSSTAGVLDQCFEVRFQRLLQRASYDLRVDGAIYATFRADANGSGGVVFQNQQTDSDEGNWDGAQRQDTENCSGGTADRRQSGPTTDLEGARQLAHVLLQASLKHADRSEGDKDMPLPLPTALTPVTNIHLVEVVDSSGRVGLKGNFSGTSRQNMVAIAYIGLCPASGLQASGETLISFKARGKSRKQSMLVEATGLAPGSYKIVINGNTAGKLNSRSGHARFMKTKKKNTLPLEIDSVLAITSLQVLDSSDQIVLSGRLGNS